MGIRLVFSLFTLIGLVLVELYVRRGFFQFIEQNIAPKRQKRYRRIYQFLNLLVFVLFFTGILALFFKDKNTYRWTSYLLGIIMMVVLPKVFFAAFLLLEDGIAVGRQLIAGKKPKEFEPSRRKFISRLGLLGAGIPFASVLHGMLRGRYDFQLHEVELVLKDLPDAFDKFRIAQISDFHAGSYDSMGPIIKGLEMLQNLQADLILFTGDMVNDFAEEVEPWMEHLGKLSAPYGKFSSLGNHDYGESVRWESEEAEKANLDRLKAYQKQMGFQLLLNEHRQIKKNGASINLLGVENWGKPPFPQKGDLEKAISGTAETDFNILLSHDPSHWEAKVLPHPRKIHLTLSGHTHGAQMGVELPGWKWSPAKYYYPQWAGLYNQDDQHLYVNRGFGFVGIPARMGIWPEITHITLRKG